MRFGHFYEAVV